MSDRAGAHADGVVLVAKAAESPSKESSPSSQTAKRGRPSAKRSTIARSSGAGHSRGDRKASRRSLRGLDRASEPRVHRNSSQQTLLRRLGLLGLAGRLGLGEPRALEAWKIRLVDGDTFWYGGERIRIRGYDAPEPSESGGFEATQRLELLLQEGQVVIIPQAVDVYGRTVAQVYVDDRNVAEVMTAEGYAKKR